MFSYDLFLSFDLNCKKKKLIAEIFCEDCVKNAVNVIYNMSQYEGIYIIKVKYVWMLVTIATWSTVFGL